MDWRLLSVLDKDAVLLDEAPLPEGSTVYLCDVLSFSEGRRLAFPLPSATAMMLSSSRQAHEAARLHLEHPSLSRERGGVVYFASNESALDCCENLMASVIFAYTALECFANEWVPTWITYKQSKKGSQAFILLGKEEIERNLHLREKLATILPYVFQKPGPKGTRAWEGFVKLEKIRNRIIHMKEADRRESDSETDTLWKTLFSIPVPHRTAKKLIDHFLDGCPYVPGLQYDKLLPIRPRWHAEYPWKD